MKSTSLLLLCLLVVFTTALRFSNPYLEKGLFDTDGFVTSVQGLLEGIGSLEHWPDVQKCIFPSSTSIESIVSAIESFEKEDSKSVAEGLVSSAKAFSGIPAAIKSCVSTARDVQILSAALKAISHPKTFAFKAKRSLLVNDVDIFDEIYTAVNDFETMQWKEYGFNIGEALAQVYYNGEFISRRHQRRPRIIRAASMPKQSSFNGSDFLIVAKGVLKGIAITKNWDQFAPCVNSTEDAVENIITAVKYFEQQDPVSVARGLAALGKALADLPVSIEDCGAVANDVAKLVKALEAISNPASFVFVVAKNLIVNGIDIYKEVYGAVEDYKTGNWEHFGENIGEALGQIFLYGKGKENLVVVKDLEGFLSM